MLHPVNRRLRHLRRLLRSEQVWRSEREKGYDDADATGDLVCLVQTH
jgi:hypothetical protein